ncbi:MAG: hypothetical protein ACREUG_09080 [Steroidobacteraceae bacterium]
MPMSPCIPRCDPNDARTFRRAAVRAPLAALAFIAATLAAIGCVACSSPGAPRVADRLDPITGNTVIVLAEPVQLVTVENRGPSHDPFAFAAPFDVDRMGHRELYLWISVPQDDGTSTHLQVYCDGRALELTETPLDLGHLQLSRAPYAPIAPWSGNAYFHLPSAALSCLAGARSIAIEYQASDKQGSHAEHFAAQAADLRGFAAFAAHLRTP